MWMVRNTKKHYEHIVSVLSTKKCLQIHNIQPTVKRYTTKAFDTWEQCQKCQTAKVCITNPFIIFFTTFFKQKRHYKINFLDCCTPRRLAVLYSVHYTAQSFSLTCINSYVTPSWEAVCQFSMNPCHLMNYLLADIWLCTCESDAGK